MHRRELFKQFGLITAIYCGSTKANNQTDLRIGVVPHISARSIASQYDPLRRYLSRGLKVDVDVSSAANWKDFYQKTRVNAFDVVVVPAHIARIMQLELSMKPVAAFHPKIKGILVSAKSKRIESPVQLRGQSLVTANPAALVTLEGESWLEKSYGLKKGHDYTCTAVRGNDSVGLAVLKGEGPAGIMCKQDFDVYPPPIKNQLAIVAQYAEFSNFIVLENSRMDSGLSVAFEQQIQAFQKPAPDSASFERLTGFKIVSKPELQELEKFEKSAAQIRHLLG
jgi:phosphonate transport system substrate-binding protein